LLRGTLSRSLQALLVVAHALALHGGAWQLRHGIVNLRKVRASMLCDAPGTAQKVRRFLGDAQFGVECVGVALVLIIAVGAEAKVALELLVHDFIVDVLFRLFHQRRSAKASAGLDRPHHRLVIAHALLALPVGNAISGSTRGRGQLGNYSGGVVGDEDLVEGAVEGQNLDELLVELADAVAAPDDLEDDVEVDNVYNDDVVPAFLKIVGLLSRSRRTHEDVDGMVLGVVECFNVSLTLLGTLTCPRPNVATLRRCRRLLELLYSMPVSC